MLQQLIATRDRYATILADPPWRFTNRTGKMAPEHRRLRRYKTMSFAEIAAQRVGVMAPRMNQVLTAARDRGVMIIFAPSETMNIYAGSPYRQRMEQAKPVKPPVPIAKTCDRDPASEPKTLPEDTKLDCDDAQLGPVARRHTRQHAGLDIIGFDGISDSGQEIYNFCAQEGIKNIVLMGVHTTTAFSPARSAFARCSSSAKTSSWPAT
jgi:hypothetical protein